MVGQCVEAGSNERPHGPRERLVTRVVTCHLGELGEKQRVAAAALEELIGECRRHVDAEHRGEQRIGLGAGQGIERHPDGDRVVVRWRPVHLDIVTLRRDQQHRPIHQRARQAAEKFE